MRKYLFIKLQAICSFEIIRNSEAGLVFVCTMFPTFSNKQAYFDFMTKTIAKKITVSWNNEQFSWVLANDHEIPESLLFLPDWPGKAGERRLWSCWHWLHKLQTKILKIIWYLVTWRRKIFWLWSQAQLMQILVQINN